MINSYRARVKVHFLKDFHLYWKPCSKIHESPFEVGARSGCSGRLVVYKKAKKLRAYSINKTTLLVCFFVL